MISSTQLNFNVNDTHQGFIAKTAVKLRPGHKARIRIPKIMADMNLHFNELEYIDSPPSMYLNDPKCRPKHGTVVKCQDYIECELDENFTMIEFPNRDPFLYPPVIEVARRYVEKLPKGKQVTCNFHGKSMRRITFNIDQDKNKVDSGVLD